MNISTENLLESLANNRTDHFIITYNSGDVSVIISNNNKLYKAEIKNTNGYWEFISISKYKSDIVNITDILDSYVSLMLYGDSEISEITSYITKEVEEEINDDEVDDIKYVDKNVLENVEKENKFLDKASK